MNITRLAVTIVALALMVTVGCKDKSEEMVCKDGLCRPAGIEKQIVEVDAPAFQKIPQLSQRDEPVNQEFAPIHETNLDNADIMSLAGTEGEFNEVALEDIEVPGVGHAEAAISGDMEFIDREYKDNLWPGGVEQGAEMDFDEF